MAIDNNKLVECLRSIVDPQSGRDIISMKLVENLKIADERVSFSVNVAGLKEEEKFSLHSNIHESVQKQFPNVSLDIHFVTKAGNTRALSQVKNIIAVASGKGGVGKSTVSVNLALGLKALGARVGLIDADLYGPSIPTMLGIQKERPKIKELYGRHRIEPIEKFGLHTISVGNIVDPEKAVVLRGPRLGGIIKQFINEVLWPELDYLIIDLPPGTGDIQLTLVQTVPVTGSIIVTTPQEVAVADAIKAMNMFRMENINVPIVGVVENMSWFIPDDMPEKKYAIFGEGGGKKLAKESNSVLLAQLPMIQAVREACDNGLPIILQEDHVARNYYLEMAKKAAQQIAVRNEVLEPTKVVGLENN